MLSRLPYLCRFNAINFILNGPLTTEISMFYYLHSIKTYLDYIWALFYTYLILISIVLIMYFWQYTAVYWLPWCLSHTHGFYLYLYTGNLWQVQCCRWNVRCDEKSPAVWPVSHPIYVCSVRFEKFNRRPSLSTYLSPFYIGPALIVLDREETDLQAYAFLMTAFIILMIYLLT